MLAIESMSGVGRSGAKPRYSSVTFAKSDCNCREARNQTAIDAAERFSPIFVAMPKFRLQMSQAAPEDCKYSALAAAGGGGQYSNGTSVINLKTASALFTNSTKNPSQSHLSR